MQMLNQTDSHTNESLTEKHFPNEPFDLAAEGSQAGKQVVASYTNQCTTSLMEIGTT